MINLALAVFVVAIIGALFGFVGVAGGVPGVAQSTLLFFLTLFVIALARTLVTAPVRIAARRRTKPYDDND